MMSISIAANIGRDFASFFQLLVFSPGSDDGTLLCSSLIVLPDNVTELEENFFIVLNLLTEGDSLSLGNNITHVTHTDDDGKIPKQNLLLWKCRIVKKYFQLSPLQYLP